MPKGIPNKRYTGEFKQMVVETMMREKLSCCEAARQFDIPDHKNVSSWERIYLMEGSQGLYIERHGRGSKGRPQRFPKEVEEDLLKEVQRLRAENAYLKNADLGSGQRATPKEKVMVIQELRSEFKLEMLLEIAQLPRATFYYYNKQQKKWISMPMPRRRLRQSTTKIRVGMGIDVSQTNCITAKYT